MGHYLLLAVMVAVLLQCHSTPLLTASTAGQCSTTRLRAQQLSHSRSLLGLLPAGSHKVRRSSC